MRDLWEENGDLYPYTLYWTTDAPGIAAIESLEGHANGHDAVGLSEQHEHAHTGRRRGVRSMTSLAA